MRRADGLLPRAAVILLFACAAAVAPLESSERYDPRLRFRTISTPRFDIHFHQGTEALARRLAGIAETVADEMEPRLGKPRMRVNVILVDQTDLSNGWATPIPYNLIEIVAAAPKAESIIGNTSDWLRLVFTHEYTHILHLERSRGWLGAIGRPFGRVLPVYPNLFLPPLLIEGIATHEESGLTHEGRVLAGDVRQIATRAAAAGRFPSLARASNNLVQWPSGQTPYIFGAYFHEYLSRTYGASSLDRLANATAALPPFFGSLAFRKVFGKPLGDLWQDFQRDTARNASVRPSAATQLTRHGFIVRAPWHSRNGRLFYSLATPHAFPALMELTSRGPRELTTQVLGGRLGGTANEVVFDQVEYVRSVAVQSDLYAVNSRSGAVRRLTRQARAADPDVRGDGMIVCTVQRTGHRALALLRMPASGADERPRILIEEPGVDYASPRWSPDGTRIAVERRALGGPSQIVLVDGASGAHTRTLTPSPEMRSADPAWSPDGRTLFFAAARGTQPFSVYAADVASGALRRLANAGDSAQSPNLSPNGRTIVFVGYTAEGFDLFSIPFADARWERIDSAGGLSPPDAASQAAGHTGGADANDYNPLRTLAPRFWTPIIESDGEDLSVGASTGGADALGRHTYYASAAWSTRGRPDWSAGYVYDRWRPTFFAATSDDTEDWRVGTRRVTEFNVGAYVPFRRVRRAQLLFGSFHAAREAYDCAGCATPVDLTIDRRALRAAWRFDTARRYGFSISDEYGVDVTASAEWTASALGSSADASAAVVDGRGFVALGPRHAVLALRGAAAAGWGNARMRRFFGVGGSGPRSPAIAFDPDAIALVRGFEADSVEGPRAAVVNADYRIPLAWVERGVGTWPLFLRSLHGALFADAGAAWEGTLTSAARRSSLGAELSADFVVGYSVPVTAAGGVAWRHDPTGRESGAALFFRLGRAF